VTNPEENVLKKVPLSFQREMGQWANGSPKKQSAQQRMVIIFFYPPQNFFKMAYVFLFSVKSNEF